MNEALETETETEAASPKPSLLPVGLAAVTLTAAFGFAFRPALADSALFWLSLAVPLSLWALFGALQLHRTGRLIQLLLPRGGDITWGASLGAILLLLTWLGRTQFVDLGSPRQSWLFLVYLQLGDPDAIQSSALLTATLLLTALSWELIFRGWIQETLDAAWGERHGWLLTWALSGLVVSPTLFLLKTADLGLNPLIFLAALGSGLLFGFLRRLTDRLPPLLIAQAVFTYFALLQFRLPGL